MDRVAVFVDAGYLFAQGSTALAGQKLSRGSIVFDAEKAIAAFGALATKTTGLPLLRIYWYDGTSTGPTPQHLSIAHLAGVKLRLGFVNSHGEQKGVDSLIVTDMIDLARNRAMCDAVLLSGDEDLRVGVQQAQQLGVRVHLVGIKPSRGSQSLFLLQEADTTVEWGPDDLKPFLSVKSSPPAATATPVGATSAPALPAPVTKAGVKPKPIAPVPPSVVPTTSAPASLSVAPATPPLNDDMLPKVAQEVAESVPASDLKALIESIQASGQTPREFDRILLARGGSRLGVHLDSQQKNRVRTLFLVACEKRFKEARAPASS